MRNPWDDFDYSAKRQVHPLDEAGFDLFNKRIENRKDADKLRLSDQHTPLPFFGSLDANFVVLMGNPGLDIERTHLEETPERRRLFDSARKHRDMRSPFVFLDETFRPTKGYEWWFARLRTIIEKSSLEKVTQNIFSAEIHPYKSMNYEPVKENLPTQRYTAHLLENFQKRGSLVLIGRARDEWIKLVPSLESYKNQIVLKNPQSSYITEGNTQPGDFQRILDAITQ